MSLLMARNIFRRFSICSSSRDVKFTLVSLVTPSTRSATVFPKSLATSASLLIAQGMEVTAVAKRLGHADASTTLRVYAHSFEERDRTASDMLEDMLIKKTMDSD